MSGRREGSQVVYAVPTDDGTWEHHEGSPPPMCDYETLYRTPPPSALVGLSSEDRAVLMRLKDALHGWINGVRVIERILAQQPAAVGRSLPAEASVDEAMVGRALAAYWKVFDKDRAGSGPDWHAMRAALIAAQQGDES